MAARGADLAEQAEEGPPGLLGDFHQQTVLFRRQVFELPRRVQGRFNLSERSFCRVEETTVFARTAPSVAFGNVEGDSVTGSPELIGESVLLVGWEPLGHPCTLHSQPLRVLPCPESLVSSHGHNIIAEKSK